MKSFILFAFAAVAMAGTGYFWHVTDVHLQLDYKEGGDVDNYCHGSGGKAGKWGEYVCNTPWRSVRNMAEFMINKSNELGIVPDFLAWTGDIMSGPEKDHSQSSLSKHFSNWTTLLTEIHDAFGGRTKIFPVIGNHDAAPQHQFPTDTDFYAYTQTFKLWKKFFSEDAGQVTYPKGGYFNELVRPGVRFIGYNAGLYYAGNEKITVSSDKDPMGQFAFIKESLQAARENNEKVMLASHICPGLVTNGGGYGTHKTWSKKMLETLNGYHDLIIGSFYGHDHRDSFQILRDTDGGDGVSIGFRTSSGTPRTNILPSVALFKYDTEYPHTLLDKIVFAYDLKEANKNGAPKWFEAYRMTTAYNVTDVSAPSMVELVERLSDYDSKVWDNYCQNIHVQKSGHTCSSSSHKKTICTIKYAYGDEADKCKAM